MAEINVNIDVRAIRDELQDSAGSLVKRIVDARKNACIEAVGEVFYENGYLPKGTTWEAWNGACWFSVDKGTNADLAHYFWEGKIYGPNFFIKEIGEWRSPKGKQKYPNGKMLKQGVGSNLGVRHWTEKMQKGSPLYQDLLDKCEEILRR